MNEHRQNTTFSMLLISKTVVCIRGELNFEQGLSNYILIAHLPPPLRDNILATALTTQSNLSNGSS